MAANHLRYSDHVDYLIAAVIYLGTQQDYWARTPENLSRELSLDESKLVVVFNGFPGIFRKSMEPSESGQHFYSLQARHAQRFDFSHIEQKTSIPPLATDKIRLIYEFILNSAQSERDRTRVWASNSIAVVAAIIAAAAAVFGR